MASQVPASLKSIGSYVKIANDNVERDPVIYYWCLFYAVQNAMKIDKSSKEALQFITGLLTTLEMVKKSCAGLEAVTNEVVAQAHIENYALKLFNFADAREKASQIDKATVQAFYTAGHVMDTLALFGEIDENIASMKKYAKWKCMQINQCLKDGTPYVSSSAENNHAEDNTFNDQNSTYGGFSQHPLPPGGTSSSSDYGYNSGTQADINSLPGIPPHSYDPPHSSPTPPAVPPPPQVPSYGFSQPQIPSSSHSSPAMSMMPPAAPVQAASGRKPTSQEFIDAKKFTKYALSALDYEDTKAAIENLRKALALIE